MSLVFYYAPWSSATTCFWALQELGVPHEKVKIDLKTKGTHTPQFLALNPNGKVPLLVHDGVPIFESIAILAHLGETFGVEKKLFPPAGIARAQAFQWLAWTNATLGAAVGRYLQNTSDLLPADEKNAKVGEIAKGQLHELLTIADKHLGKNAWMVGDGFTFVDLHLAGAMVWIGRIGIETKKYEHLEAWSAKCTARPAFAAAMA